MLWFEWLGVALLQLPLAVALFPPLVRHLETKFYWRSDRLELEHYRSFARAALLCCVILAPGALVHFAENELSLARRALHWLQLAAYVFVPCALALLRRPARRPLDPFDAALVCAIFVPVKVQRYFPDTFLPDVRIALVGPRWPHLSVLLTTAFNTMLLVFLVLRPLRDLRLSLSVTLRTGLRFFVAAIFAAAGVAAFAALESDSEPQEHLSLRLGLRVFFAYWLCFALPLETFFRGVLQNLLHSALDVRAAVREYTAADSKPTQTSLTLSLSAIGLSASETASALAGPLPAQVRDSLAVPLLPQHQPDSEPPATHWAPSRTEARDFVPWHEEHKAFLSRGVFCWLAFPHLRDLLVLIVSGALFAVCIVDWRDFSLSLFLSSFALSVLLGWLWRHTSHTLLSSLLHAGAVFVARYALGKNVWDQQ